MLGHGNFNTAQQSSPKISVNVPVFNTEKYLHACLDSLSSQTFEDFEVVCIDDGSTDNSVEIIQEFIDTDKRFRLVQHKINQGLSAARNTGVRESRGIFIVNVDSDDMASPDMLYKLWKASDNCYYDIVLAGFIEFYDDGGVLFSYRPNHSEEVSESVPFDPFKTIPTLWAKMIKKSLFTDNNIWCPERKLYEDLATFPRLLFAANSYTSVPEILYYYRGSRPGSLINKVTGKQITDYADVYRLLLDYFEQHGCGRKQNRFTKSRILDQFDSDMRYISSKFIASKFTDTEILEHLKQLLLTKVAFLELRSDLKKLDKDELMHRLKVKRFM
jgi:glycosyltransferase involved in cell wall biosynthesis